MATTPLYDSKSEHSSLRCWWLGCSLDHIFESEIYLYEHIKNDHIFGAKTTAVQCTWRPIYPGSRMIQAGDMCGLEFKNKHHMVDHLASHFSPALKPFPCEFCRNTFRHRQGLRRHELDEHQDVLHLKSKYKKRSTKVLHPDLDPAKLMIRGVDKGYRVYPSRLEQPARIIASQEAPPLSANTSASHPSLTTPISSTSSHDSNGLSSLRQDMATSSLYSPRVSASPISSPNSLYSPIRNTIESHKIISMPSPHDIKQNQPTATISVHRHSWSGYSTSKETVPSPTERSRASFAIPASYRPYPSPQYKPTVSYNRDDRRQLPPPIPQAISHNQRGPSYTNGYSQSDAFLRQMRPKFQMDSLLLAPIDVTRNHQARADLSASDSHRTITKSGTLVTAASHHDKLAVSLEKDKKPTINSFSLSVLLQP